MKKIGLYLDQNLRNSVSQGNHNFFNILIKAFAGRGIEIDLRPNTSLERLMSVGQSEYNLFHLEDPFHDNALDIRMAYMYPFWRIERAKWREDYVVAGKTFVPDQVDATEAARFFGFWKQKMHKHGWEEPKAAGYVFIPLQGRLLEKRHGQTMTPVEMIKATLQQDPDREIVVKLHPKETYTSAEHQCILELAKDDRVTLSSADVHTLLSGCDYVVTQNSSVVIKGIFHKVPAILFGRSDFHHIFQGVESGGLKESFNNVMRDQPDYEKYLYWFLQINSINAGKVGAGDKILNICRGHGWKI